MSCRPIHDRKEAHANLSNHACIPWYATDLGNYARDFLGLALIVGI